MPLIELHVIAGYGADEKRRLGEALTDAVRSVVPASPDLVTVLIHDVPPENYYRGRVTRTPAPAREDPSVLVRAYLSAMEQRNLANAQTMLASDFVMQFPGAAPMTSLAQLIDWAKPRYNFVAKSYEGVDAMQSAGEAAVVYCRGTLSGEWLDGSSFSGIRFIDRFEVSGGKITRQDVWNDVAEARAQQ